MSYHKFAYIYDRLMNDVDYQLWLHFVNTKIKSLTNEEDIKTVLDLGCGTGELSISLAKNGFDVSGVDISEDMLAVAEAKAAKHNVKIDFYHANMTEFEAIKQYDCVVIFCDSLNYLLDEKDIKKTFDHVYRLLKSGGIFMFDVHSEYKITDILQNQTFAGNDEDVSFIWNCYPGTSAGSVEHDLTFFVKNEKSNLYERFDEFHIQRTFAIDTYKTWLNEIGFHKIDISADFSETITNNSERIFFAATK